MGPGIMAFPRVPGYSPRSQASPSSFIISSVNNRPLFVLISIAITPFYAISSSTCIFLVNFIA